MGWIAPLAVAAAQKREEDEAIEELRQRDGPSWEFKLLRSTTFAFANEETFREALTEEGAAGWQLARQLDENRLILRRPVSARADDALLGEAYNPYREYYGRSHMVLVGVLIALLLAGVLGLVVTQVRSTTGAAIILGVIVVLGLVMVLLMLSSGAWRHRRKSKG